MSNLRKIAVKPRTSVCEIASRGRTVFDDVSQSVSFSHGRTVFDDVSQSVSLSHGRTVFGDVSL